MLRATQVHLSPYRKYYHLRTQWGALYKGPIAIPIALWHGPLYFLCSSSWGLVSVLYSFVKRPSQLVPLSLSWRNWYCAMQGNSTDVYKDAPAVSKVLNWGLQYD